jgi:hypothetical protein
MLSFASSQVAGAMARDGREKSEFRLFTILIGPAAMLEVSVEKVFVKTNRTDTKTDLE